MQQIINALASGAVYALMALGYTMVFGVLRLINFAHCDVMMAGAFAGYLCHGFFHLNAVFSILISMAFCGILGVLIEKIAYRPLRHAPSVSALIAAVGVSLVLQYGTMLLFGAEPKAYPKDFIGGVVQVGTGVLPLAKVTALALSVLMMAALQAFLKCSRRGRAMRAVACEPYAAKLCGVKEDGVISSAFFIGSALAGAAGVVYGAMYSISPLMGTAPGLKAFAAAVIGGIGSIPGAVLGGLVLGLAEALASEYISTAFKDCLSFAFLILVLLVRPGGIMDTGAGTDRT